ncbi:MAG: hypothetical protein ABUS51_07410 [Acidobacteriota bacterium]
MRGAGGVAAMLLFSGALIGFSSSLFFPHRYAVSAELAFPGTPGVTRASYLADAGKLYENSLQATLLPQSLELMIRRSPSFKERLYLQSFPELLEDVRRNLSVTSIQVEGGLKGAKIEFEDDDPDTALDLVREIVGQMGDNAAALSGTKKVSDVIRIVETPRSRLIGITPALLTAIGLAAGLAASVAVCLPGSRSTS